MLGLLQVELGVMEKWQRQALLDARTLDGKTPLAIATMRGSVQLVSHLGACGATADQRDAVTHSTPVHWAGTPLCSIDTVCLDPLASHVRVFCAPKSSRPLAAPGQSHAYPALGDGFRSGLIDNTPRICPTQLIWNYTYIRIDVFWHGEV